MGVLDNLLYGSVQYLTRNSALYKVVGAISDMVLVLWLLLNVDSLIDCHWQRLNMPV